jgi:hypothetical protein
VELTELKKDFKKVWDIFFKYYLILIFTEIIRYKDILTLLIFLFSHFLALIGLLLAKFLLLPTPPVGVFIAFINFVILFLENRIK